MARVAVLATLAAMCMAAVAVNALSFEKVHLIDYEPTTGNLFFRGDMPCNDTAFDISNLLSYMQQRAATAGVPWPQTWFLTDISLNNPVDENAFETQFWADPAHATLGKLISWPLGFAGVLPPASYPLATAEQMALPGTPNSVWEIDQLPSRIPEARAMFLAASSVTQIIYVHCTAGCDRTGEFVGSYRMMYEAKNTTEMYALDTAECGRSPNWFGTAGLEWWCLYYYQITNNTAGIANCEDFATCDLFGKCKPTTPEQVVAAIEAAEFELDPVTLEPTAVPAVLDAATRSPSEIAAVLQKAARALHLTQPFGVDDLTAKQAPDSFEQLGWQLRRKLKKMGF